MPSTLRPAAGGVRVGWTPAGLQRHAQVSLCPHQSVADAYIYMVMVIYAYIYMVTVMVMVMVYMVMGCIMVKTLYYVLWWKNYVLRILVKIIKRASFSVALLTAKQILPSLTKAVWVWLCA